MSKKSEKIKAPLPYQLRKLNKRSALIFYSLVPKKRLVSNHFWTKISKSSHSVLENSNNVAAPLRWTALDWRTLLSTACLQLSRPLWLEFLNFVPK